MTLKPRAAETVPVVLLASETTPSVEIALALVSFCLRV